jgi:hypothetical protein
MCPSDGERLVKAVEDIDVLEGMIVRVGILPCR